jgi:hypothetical protein
VPDGTGRCTASGAADRRAGPGAKLADDRAAASEVLVR